MSHIARIYTMICNERVDTSSCLFDSSSNWLYTVLVDDAIDFIAYMRNKGIEASKVHARNDTKKIFREFKRELPGVEEFDRRHVCVPCGWWLSDEDISIVVNALKKY
jgi:dTDP-4-amino-4,6-dideoxygalactose transaminase